MSIYIFLYTYITGTARPDLLLERRLFHYWAGDFSASETFVQYCSTVMSTVHMYRQELRENRSPQPTYKTVTRNTCRCSHYYYVRSCEYAIRISCKEEERAHRIKSYRSQQFCQLALLKCIDYIMNFQLFHLLLCVRLSALYHTLPFTFLRVGFNYVDCIYFRLLEALIQKLVSKSCLNNKWMT